jgi:hypothetical protein
VTGLLLVWPIGFEFLQRGWLIVSIVLYLIVLAIGFGVLVPALRTLVPATRPRHRRLQRDHRRPVPHRTWPPPFAAPGWVV